MQALSLKRYHCQVHALNIKAHEIIADTQLVNELSSFQCKLDQVALPGTKLIFKTNCTYILQYVI